jgi:hypothetical protein
MMKNFALCVVIALVLLLAPSCNNPLSDAIQAKIDEYNFEPIRRAELVESEALVLHGGTRQLTLVTIPDAATNKNATWTSSAPAVATVSSSGLVSGVGYGRATIGMVTEDGGFTGSCEVAVSIIRWHTALGADEQDYAYCVRPTSDGGYIACGYYGFDTSTFFDRALIVKLDANGAKQWEVKPTNSLWLQSIRELPDGSFVAAGVGHAIHSDSNYYYGSYLVKIYPNGTVAWEAGGPWEDDGQGTHYAPVGVYGDVILTSSGGFLAVGSTNRMHWNGTSYDYTSSAAIVPHDASGLAATATSCFFGSVEGDYLFAIEASGDGNYIAAGLAGSVGFYLLKVDPDLAPVVAFDTDGEKRFGTDGRLRGICVDGGSLYCIGTSNDDNVLPVPSPILAAHGDADTYVAKLNATTAVIEWQSLLGGSGLDSGHGIAVDVDGGIVVTGSSPSSDIAGALEANHGGGDVYVAKLAANGQVVWQTNLGGASGDSGYFIAPAPGGGYVLAGGTKSTDLLELLDPLNDTLGEADFYIAKLF